MIRISNEDGRNAAARNWGRFGLSAIPWALGMGASVWLGVYIGIHQFRKDVSQEQRAAVAVGAGERPSNKIKFDFSAQTYCAGVTRADLEGDTLRLYAKNNCHGPLTGMDWHYEMLGPDGTILHDGFMNQRNNDHCPTPRLVGDSAECVFTYAGSGSITVDDRAATMRVWTVPYSRK